MVLPTVLTIAGSDPSGGAGIQRDLIVFHDLQVHGRSVITALTAQGEDRFFSLNPVTTGVFMDELRAVSQSAPLAGVKLGALGCREVAYQTFRFLERAKPPLVVVDPVMRSTSGGMLLESEALPILTQCILPLAHLVTPNLAEASVLVGQEVATLSEMERAARHIHDRFHVPHVLVKGGHLTEVPVDVWFDGKDICHFASKQRYPQGMRGTGCALSAAILAFGVRGLSLGEAIGQAKRYLEQLMSSEINC